MKTRLEKALRYIKGYCDKNPSCDTRRKQLRMN